MKAYNAACSRYESSIACGLVAIGYFSLIAVVSEGVSRRDIL